MKLNQLKYFCEVCKYNNISKAAESLYVSQPSISVAIRELEDELGQVLFIRSNNHLNITSAGRKLYAMAQDLLADEQAILTEFSSMQNENTMRIGIFPDLVYWVIPRLKEVYRKLKDKYPDLDVNLYEIDVHNSAKVLLDKKVDLIFSNSGVDYPDIFAKKVISRQPLMVCMNKNHPLARKKVITARDLVHESIIGNYYGNEDFIKWLKDFFGDLKFDGEVKYYFTQNDAVRALLLNNMGIAMARPQVNGMNMEGLTAVPLDKSNNIDIEIVYDTNEPVNNPVADLINAMDYK